MKFRKFLDVSRTSQQGYFKEGIELLYPSIDRTLAIAILPAYDPMDPKPTSWKPAVVGEEESDFYTTVRAAKFVGHGNRRAKTSFLSPRTFDLNADDPYEAFYDYCSRSDQWHYLTKDSRSKTITGEVEGMIFPRMKNFFVANVIDVSVGPRGGVFVTELSESVMKNILYAPRKNGSRVDGLAFMRDTNGELAFGDITNPDNALVIEIAYGGKSYVAREAINDKGMIVRTKIPETLLQHRLHMEEPGSFLIKESPQKIVDRLAGLLRGYKAKNGKDEICALEEAMEFAYGKNKYIINNDAQEISIPDEKVDPFAGAAEKVVESNPEDKAGEINAAIKRGVEHEKYVPSNLTTNPIKSRKGRAKPIITDDSRVIPMEHTPFNDECAPGEDIDPSDIAAVRAMLSGGK